MRKILSDEELEKKKNRNNMVISIVLLLILLASSAGFAFLYNSEDSNNVSTNGKVQSYGDRWAANFNGATLIFTKSVEDSFANTSINIIPDFNQFYSKTIYIDSSDPVVYNEIGSNLGPFSARIQNACYSNCENSSYVEKDCSSTLIVYTPSSKNKVYQNQSCTFIEGDMAAVDAFLYKIFGLN